MKNEIYLDFNLILSIVKREENSDYTIAKISNLKKRGFIFPYSPAHIEEIAVNYQNYDKNEARKVINQRLNLIRWISQSFEYLPGIPSYEHVINTLKEVDGHPSLIKVKESFLRLKKQYDSGLITGKNTRTQLIKENPKDCMARVIKDFDLTEVAKNNDLYHMGRRTRSSLRSNFDILGKEIETDNITTFEEDQKKRKLGPRRLNQIPYDEIFLHEGVQSLLVEDFKLNNIDLKKIKKGANLINDHAYRESVMNIIFNTLERTGYYQEKNNNETKIRSRMHDITHAIYGCTATYFITNDERFRHKLKATLSFLNVSCEVLSLNEFLHNDFINQDTGIIYV